MRLGSEFPETLGAILLGGKRQPPIQGKCLDEEGQLRCLLKPGSLGTWLGLAHPEGLVLCSGLGSAGGGWPFPGKGALPARLQCEQPTCWDPRIQQMRCSGNGSKPPAMTALWLPTEDVPSHGNPPCTSTSWLCARSSDLASLSFNFWTCKMGMIVASTSQELKRVKYMASVILQGQYFCCFLFCILLTEMGLWFWQKAPLSPIQNSNCSLGMQIICRLTFLVLKWTKILK